MRSLGVWILRSSIIAVFAYAGVLKILRPDQFAQDVANYRLLHPLTSAVVAIYLPWLELVTALVLLFRRWRIAASVLALFLSGVFLAALSWAWSQSLDISCGCFGSKETTLFAAGVRAAILLTATAILFRIEWSSGSIRTSFSDGKDF